MYERKQGVAISRFIGVICAVMVLVSGVTFAALQSQTAALKGSKITSATASLQIGDGQGGFAATANGFEFNNVEPGGAAMPSPGYNLILRNNGTSNLALKLVADPNTVSNPSGADLDKVFINLTTVAGPNAGQSQQFSLKTLLGGYNSSPIVLNHTLAAGQTAQYTLQVQMSADAVTSAQSGITVNGIDLIFSGSSVVSQ